METMESHFGNSRTETLSQHMKKELNFANEKGIKWKSLLQEKNTGVLGLLNHKSNKIHNSVVDSLGISKYFQLLY